MALSYNFSKIFQLLILLYLIALDALLYFQLLTLASVKSSIYFRTFKVAVLK